MDLSILKLVDLKKILRENNKKLSGNKQDLIQRIITNNIPVNINDYNPSNRRGRKIKQMKDYDYDNMTVVMLKKLLKGYMLKLTGRKQELIARIKSHVSKQDEDEDFKLKIIQDEDPTLEELESFELPKYVPTNLLLPKKKEVRNVVADKAIKNIETTVNSLIDIGRDVNEPLTQFMASSFISDIAYLNIYKKYNKKSIVITKNVFGNRATVTLGIDVYIPDMKSKEFKNGIFYNMFGTRLDEVLLAKFISTYINDYNEDAIVMPFNFRKRAGNIAHANLLIYRPREKILEWFEPHGKRFSGTELKEAIAIQTYLKKGLLNLIDSTSFRSFVGKFRNPTDKISLVETQILVNDNRYGEIGLQGKNAGGTCMVWCVLIAELVFLNPTKTTSQIVTDMFDITQGIDQRERINNIMKGYIVETEKDVTNYLEKKFKIKTNFGDIKYNITSKKEKENIELILIDVLYYNILEKMYKTQLKKMHDTLI